MTPAEILTLLKNVRKSGPGWTARCPGHRDRHNSLSVAEGRDGRVLVYCFAGCEFKDIVAALGLRAEDFHLGRVNKQRRGSGYNRSPERERIKAAAWKLKIAEHTLRILYRDRIHLLDGLQCAANCRLTALLAGNPPRYRNEVELCWWILADVWPQLRFALAAYFILSFASAEDRARFVLRAEERPIEVGRVLYSGVVRDHENKFVQVTL